MPPQETRPEPPDQATKKAFRRLRQTPAIRMSTFGPAKVGLVTQLRATRAAAVSLEEEFADIEHLQDRADGSENIRSSLGGLVARLSKALEFLDLASNTMAQLELKAPTIGRQVGIEEDELDAPGPP